MGEEKSFDKTLEARRSFMPMYYKPIANITQNKELDVSSKIWKEIGRATLSTLTQKYYLEQ